jgi:hypothetical protein
VIFGCRQQDGVHLFILQLRFSAQGPHGRLVLPFEAPRKADLSSTYTSILRSHTLELKSSYISI